MKYIITYFSVLIMSSYSYAADLTERIMQAHKELSPITIFVVTSGSNSYLISVSDALIEGGDQKELIRAHKISCTYAVKNLMAYMQGSRIKTSEKTETITHVTENKNGNIQKEVSTTLETYVRENNEGLLSHIQDFGYWLDNDRILCAKGTNLGKKRNIYETKGE